MFQFTAYPPTILYIQIVVTAYNHGWVTPFGNPRIKAWLTAPRGLSQPSTSFIGTLRQGIRHVPLSNFFTLAQYSLRNCIETCLTSSLQLLVANSSHLGGDFEIGEIVCKSHFLCPSCDVHKSCDLTHSSSIFKFTTPWNPYDSAEPT